MIIVLVKYICKDGMREKFLETIKERNIDVLSRSEAGNIRYDYSYAAEDENTLILTELWKDEEAIKSHGLEPHFALLGELKKEYVEDTIIERYSATKM